VHSVALCTVALAAKQETGEMAEVLRVAQRVIDLADGDATMGDLIIGSPLALAIALRGVAHFCLGMAGWRDDLRRGVAMACASDPFSLAAVMWFTYITAIPYGVLLPDATALRDTAEALAVAEQSGDDFVLDVARTARGVILVRQDGAEREAGLDLLAKIRERALNERFSLHALPIADIHIAREKARLGDFRGAIELARTVVDDLFASGGCLWSGLAATVLVEALLQRGGDADVEDAQTAIDRLAAVPTDPGFVLNEIPLLRLRALLARARGDEAAYRDYRDRYRDMARTLGFEGHIAWAKAMP
jgi:adenylate cyclase